MNDRDQAKALSDHGAALKKARLFPAAAVHFRRALALWPENGLIWENLGAVLYDMDRPAEALEVYAEAQRLGPISYKNLGLILAALGRFDEAEAAFRRESLNKPDDHAARWNMANLHLALGDYRRGFAEYESRFDFLGTGFFPKMPYPIWDGRSDLNDKTIMIAPEQGAGDCILMSRYFVELKKRYPGARILQMVPANLQSLFWGYRDIVEFVPMGVPWPEADCACWLMSLPRHLGTTLETIPADPGVIRARVEPYKDHVELPVPNVASMRVGLRWTGNPEMKQNPSRSVPFNEMARLLDLPNVCFYSLQVGHGADDVRELGYDQLIWDTSKDLERGGYVGTATAMLHLDLVVTTCTSVAHLAGALGIPTWVMLCRDAYWVWMRDRDRSPWYPSVRLFRQDDHGEWGPVIERVRGELKEAADLHLRAAA